MIVLSVLALVFDVEIPLVARGVAVHPVKPPVGLLHHGSDRGRLVGKSTLRIVDGNLLTGRIYGSQSALGLVVAEVGLGIPRVLAACFLFGIVPTATEQ